MEKRSNRKMGLSRETLRQLDHYELQTAVAGVNSTVTTVTSATGTSSATLTTVTILTTFTD